MRNKIKKKREKEKKTRDIGSRKIFSLHPQHLAKLDYWMQHGYKVSRIVQKLIELAPYDFSDSTDGEERK